MKEALLKITIAAAFIVMIVSIAISDNECIPLWKTMLGIFLPLGCIALVEHEIHIGD